MSRSPTGRPFSLQPSAFSLSPAPHAPPSPGAEEAQKPLFAAFLVCWLVVLTGALLSINTARDWPLILDTLLLTATATTLNGLARRLPWQNVAAVAMVIGLAGVGFEVLSAWFSSSAGGLGSELTNWRFAAGWVVVLINTRGVARLILRPWRGARFYGLWVIAAGSALASVFGGAWRDVAAGAAGGAFPSPGRLLLGAAGSFLALLAAAPFLINKRPVTQPLDAHPLAVWMLLLLLLGAASQSGQSRALCALLLVVSGTALMTGRWRRPELPSSVVPHLAPFAALQGSPRSPQQPAKETQVLPR